MRWYKRFMLEGLIVDEARMRTNLGVTRGLIVAEAVMMGLAPHLGRTEAHDVVYAACRQAIAANAPLADVLNANPAVNAHLSAAEIERLCDPVNYLGSAARMVDRVVGAKHGSNQV